MERLAKIRGGLIDLGLDAVLITDKLNQRYATGFAFTDGAVLITLDRAFLITDSRYIEAAQQQAQGVQVVLYDRRRPLTSCIKDILRAERVYALAAEDTKLSHARYLAMERELGLELSCAGDLFERLRASKDED